MPDLITQEVFDETIDLIEKRKTTGIVLERMQKWYEHRGIHLYNLFFTEKVNDGKKTKELWALLGSFENLVSGITRQDIFEDSLKYYVNICQEFGIEYNSLDNFIYPRQGICSYYFVNIWRNEIVAKAGKEICPYIESYYHKDGVEKVVNSGFGIFTVFTVEKGLTDDVREEIINLVKQKIYNMDCHNIIKKTDELVEFDKISVLEETYKGNLYYYYK